MHSTLAKKVEAVRRRGWRSMPEIGCRVPARATSGFLPTIEAKLRIGAPNDKYEQEADRIADEVMKMPHVEQAGALHRSESVQRTCVACSGGGELCPECEEELQRQPKKNEREFPKGAEPGATRGVPPPLEANIRVMRGRGEPLTESERGFFEPRFGRDFSAVRVHTGPGTDGMAQWLNARAFTVGSEIVFGRSEYKSESAGGRRLLAHELTHVVQQGRNGTGNIIQRQSPPESVAPRAITSVIFLEHPSELYHGFDPNDQLKNLAVPEGKKRKLAVKIQPSGAQPNYATTDPSLISITPIADGVEVASLGGGGSTGRLPAAEIQATDGSNVLDQVRVVILPP